LLNSGAKIGFYLNSYTQISPVAGETAAFFDECGAKLGKKPPIAPRNAGMT
jgi:hypothetical protein